MEIVKGWIWGGEVGAMINSPLIYFNEVRGVTFLYIDILCL